jgi:peptidoglycan/xylan/chitin deacetylase (PgdA/CDA1 family)
MQRIPILTYLRVVEIVPTDDYYHLCLPHEVFATQMRSLADAGYQTISLDRAATLMRGRALVQPRQVVLTFDDGYLDTFEIAAPILRRYGFTATLFLVAGLVGKRSLWDAGKCCTAPLMDRPRIEQLLRWGFAAGSHTVTHPELAALAPEDACREIVRSRDMLEQRLSRPVATFCYPYGEWNETTYTLVRGAGYAAACNDAWRPEHRPFALARRDPGQGPHPLAARQGFRHGDDPALHHQV